MSQIPSSNVAPVMVWLAGTEYVKIQFAEQFILASEPQLPVNGASWPVCAVFNATVVWIEPSERPEAVLPSDVEITAPLTNDDAARNAPTKLKTKVLTNPSECGCCIPTTLACAVCAPPDLESTTFAAAAYRDKGSCAAMMVPLMKAVRIHQHGGPEVLKYEDIPQPAIKVNEVLVRVRACALNHLDLWVRNGL